MIDNGALIVGGTHLLGTHHGYRGVSAPPNLLWPLLQGKPWESNSSRSQRGAEEHGPSRLGRVLNAEQKGSWRAYSEIKQQNIFRRGFTLHKVFY